MQEDALLCNQQMKQQKWHKKQVFFSWNYTRHKSLIFTKFLEEKNVANFHTHNFIFPLCSALDRNEYNHITATYFLLAERKLRMQRPSSQRPKASNTKKLLQPSNDEEGEEMSSETFAAASKMASTSSPTSEQPLASPPLPPIQLSSSVPPVNT